MKEVLLLIDQSEPSGQDWFFTFVDGSYAVYEEIVKKPDDLIDLVNEVNVERKDIILKFGKEEHIPNLRYADAILRFKHAEYTNAFAFSTAIIIDGEEAKVDDLSICSISKRIFVAVFGQEPQKGDALAIWVTDFKTHPTAQSLVKLSHAYKKRLYKEE